MNVKRYTAPATTQKIEFVHTCLSLFQDIIKLFDHNISEMVENFIKAAQGIYPLSLRSRQLKSFNSFPTRLIL